MESNNSTGTKKNATGYIVGGVVAAIVLVAGLIGGYLYYRKKHSYIV